MFGSFMASGIPVAHSVTMYFHKLRLKIAKVILFICFLACGLLLFPSLCRQRQDLAESKKKNRGCGCGLQVTFSNFPTLDTLCEPHV